MAKETQEIFLSGINIDQHLKMPIYKQVYHQFREAILNGRLQPGEMLPPTRELAKFLGISRTTVLLAFDHLLLEGYIKGRAGAGTYVNNDIPENYLYAETTRPKPQNKDFSDKAVSSKGLSLASFLDRERDDYDAFLPFKPGVPDLIQFPYPLWGKLLYRAAQQLSPLEFGYSSSAGYKPLRQIIASYLRRARAVNCHAGQVIITNGAQQGIDLVCRVLLASGDPVGFEDPGYPGARDILNAAGMKILPLPLDKEGICFDHTSQRPSLIYATPSHQYPLGVTMSLRRRLALLEYANNIGAWILEDDYDSEYRYNGQPLSSLQGIDRHQQVIYMGTFSKVMFPGIRLGYLVVPEVMAEAFIAAKLLNDRNAPIIEQAALATFISEGHFGRHIRKMRLLYQARKDFFYRLVAEKLPDHLQLHPTEAGLHTIAWLKQESEDIKFAEVMRQGGVNTPALSDYTISTEVDAGLVLGYAAYTDAQIEEAVLRMKSLLE